MCFRKSDLLFVVIVSALSLFLLKKQYAQAQEVSNGKIRPFSFADVNGVWPISKSTSIPDVLTSPFGPRNLLPNYPYDFHDGVDIRTPDVFGNPASGVHVHAFYTGGVRDKGTFKTRSGLDASFVQIQHQDPTNGDYFWTEYVHVEMDDVWDVLLLGLTVTTGKYILDSGNVGTTTPHLHFNGLVYPPNFPPPSGRPDREIDTINPMRNDGLNYQNFGAPQIGQQACNLTGTGQKFVEFEISTPGTELDLNRIDLSYAGEKVSVVFDAWDAQGQPSRMNTDAIFNLNGDGLGGNEDGQIGAKTSLNRTISIRITTFNFSPNMTQKLKFRYINLPSQWTTSGFLLVEAYDTENIKVNSLPFNCSGTAVDDEGGAQTSIIPNRFDLLQNHPNPFNPSTSIRFALPKRSTVSLSIYDMHGRLVHELAAQKLYNAGWGDLVWDGTNTAGLPVASGAYFYRLNAESLENKKRFSQTKKLLLVR